MDYFLASHQVKTLTAFKYEKKKTDGFDSQRTNI
jgi:hypothetical protein